MNLLFQRASLVAAAVALLSSACTGAPRRAGNPLRSEHWVGTWSASPMAADSVPGENNAGFTNQTVRQIIHVSIAGKRVRVGLSNAYGTVPLHIGALHIASQVVAASIAAGSDRALQFNGSSSIIIPVGGAALSDPVDFDVAAFADIAVSVYFPDATGPITWHQLGVQTAYVSATGNFAGSTDMPQGTTATSRFALWHRLG